LCVCVRACVRVCVCERERVGGEGGGGGLIVADNLFEVADDGDRHQACFRAWALELRIRV